MGKFTTFWREMMRVAFISCAKDKQKGRHKAKDIYISNLFKLSLEYASRDFDKVFILSAKFGVLELETYIRDYELNLNKLPVGQRKKWAEKVAMQIRQSVPHDAELHFFCGRGYRKFVIEILGEGRCFSPLARLGFGQQLRWYKSRL